MTEPSRGRSWDWRNRLSGWNEGCSDDRQRAVIGAGRTYTVGRRTKVPAAVATEARPCDFGGGAPQTTGRPLNRTSNLRSAVAGIITGLRVVKSRKGDMYAQAQLEDTAGKIDLICFPEAYKTLSEQMDRPMATLIGDLKERGLLDSTLVIWMGEFGRTPGHGKNHYARAWSSVLAGAGLKVGQVVGKTDAKGNDVTDRPISAPDFMATVCKALGIDYTKNYTARGGRPMHKVAKEARVVTQVFA